jgi:ribosomal protein S18 acetylase RimI-like enzyme
MPAMHRQVFGILRLTADDAARLRALRVRSLRDAPEAFSVSLAETEARPIESWQQQLAELATFVATTEDRDVGIVRGGKHELFEDAASLVSMWVAPSARRQGLGLALIDAVVQWARAEGYRRLFLGVSRTNEPAFALYQRAGFSPSEAVDAAAAPEDQLREAQLVMML